MSRFATPSNTLMIVEVAGSGINWAEPRDLDATKITFGINDGSAQGISSSHGGGVVNAAMCDGSVHSLSNSTAPQQIKAMTTIAGGEGQVAPF